jgi:3D (Asp-Asp-Asp) domain-containing protein
MVVVLVLAAFVPAAAEAQPRARSRTPARMRMIATAYCDHGTTDSGVQTRRGTIAADPRLLPMGSVVTLRSTAPQYSGTYTVTDTGAKIKGRKVDIFIPSCAKAKAFGKRPVFVTVTKRAVAP